MDCDFSDQIAIEPEVRGERSHRFFSERTYFILFRDEFPVPLIQCVNRRSNLTLDRRPILTPSGDVFWR